MDFKDRLTKLRLRSKLTVGQLASLIGVPETTITQWEKGVSKPRLFYIPILSRELGVSQDYLLYGDERSIDKLINGKIVDKVIIARHGDDAFYLQIIFTDKSVIKITDKVMFSCNVHETFKEVSI